MEWRSDYAMGHRVVDTQHEQLFRVATELEAGVRTQDAAAVAEALGQLHVYAVRHFSVEEKLMRTLEYPGLAEQERTHAAFAQAFTALHQRFATEGLTPELGGDLRKGIAEWLGEHVLGLDQDLAQYYREAVAQGRVGTD